MSTDRTLTSVLRAFQNIYDPQQTSTILSTTTYLLTTLSNPLNVTLLTSQLLISTAIWTPVDDSRIWYRIISIFENAAITVRKSQFDIPQNPQQGQGGGISCDDWARAVVQGADNKSPRWRHLLVIGGLLLGMEGQNRQSLSIGLRMILERAMVTAANLALADQRRDGGQCSAAIVLALSHASDLLSEGVKRNLDNDMLAPIAVNAIIGAVGYQEGDFLEAVNFDVQQVSGNRFDWPMKSPSFLQLQEIASKPLVLVMGPLSRLLAYAIGNMASTFQLKVLLDDIAIFASKLVHKWHGNKLSEVDLSEEEIFLTADTKMVTFPALWQVLKTVMFTVVNILRAAISRSLVDRVLILETFGSVIASQVLHSLRNVYFISSRLGSNSFSAYNFSFLASIDILCHFPEQSRLFLNQIRPSQAGQIPGHPLDRNFDLFFLNSCEHFTLVLSAQDNEDLIVAAALPYLNPGVHHGLVDIFEAAHSATLAVFATPHNSPLTAKIIPFYVEALFSSFPTNLTPRQFRFAFKALLQITTPPAPLSAIETSLPDTLLELLHNRAVHASTTPLLAAVLLKSEDDASLNGNQSLLSEQAVLMLSLLDSLPFLPCRLLEEWLPMSADLLNLIDDKLMHEVCRSRFWDVLESGEMDIDRAAVCVSWWSTRGGREMVLFGRRKTAAGDSTENGNEPYMSGGLGLSRYGGRL